MNEDAEYSIVVGGELSLSWSEWFDGLAITSTRTPKGTVTTTLCGPVADQAALRGILCTLWDLNLTLISVQCHLDDNRRQENPHEH
jgi:hypothetical protein